MPDPARVLSPNVLVRDEMDQSRNSRQTWPSRGKVHRRDLQKSVGFFAHSCCRWRTIPACIDPDRERRALFTTYHFVEAARLKPSSAALRSRALLECLRSTDNLTTNLSSYFNVISRVRTLTTTCPFCTRLSITCCSLLLSPYCFIRRSRTFCPRPSRAAKFL